MDVRSKGVGRVTGFGDFWLRPETWGGGIDRSAGACMCSSSSARIRTVAPAETSFVLRSGQLNNSLGSGHCVFTCDSARGLHEENETETETVEI